MAIFELWNTLKKKFEPGLAKGDLDTNCTYSVDLLACLFMEIRCIIFYQDGQQAFEKNPTYQERLDFSEKTVESAQIVWRPLENDIRNGRCPSKKEEKEFSKDFRKDFTLDSKDKQAMVDYPSQQGWRVILAPLKANVTIGKSCGDSDVVVARIVEEYARDSNVHRRNPTANDFKPSPSVFTCLTQKPVKKLLWNQESRNKRRSTMEDHVRRDKNYQTSNRSRTVEPPRGGDEDNAS
ncbi:hypothetical protein BGZ80_009393 [Entomortierella chlamydospora]|uniref:Uncharacterized protein n=1 Tax=Entomortierella chlamydospora TaxID=101097 RepID=A0A9P6MX98_9FUNG|nr:hypothetical protein BGZ80_009393 [Entomortierella chlamydospora]